MAEERTLGLVRAREIEDDDPSKAALQRRMEETRDSISNTVTEIRDTVNEKYESVKEALDWREHFRRQPIGWTLGAAGVGFFAGYGLAAALTDNGEKSDYVSVSDSYARPLVSQRMNVPTTEHSAKTNGHDEGPGLIERFKETSAYDRLSREAGSLGDRLVEELSTTAHTVLLPLLLNKLKGWIGVDLAEKPEPKSAAAASMGNRQAAPTI